MFDNVKNYMVLNNEETNEEHIGKIIEIDKESKKIKLRLVDDNRNLYYRRDKEIEVLVPKESNLYCFHSLVIYYDVLERIITIEYPEELTKVIKRKHKRYDINLPIDIQTEYHQLPSISFDLCLGGISFLASPKFVLKDEIVIKLKDESLKDEEFKVRLLSKKEFKYQGKDYILYGGEFINLQKDSFEKLILFLGTKGKNLTKS